MTVFVALAHAAIFLAGSLWGDLYRSCDGLLEHTLYWVTVSGLVAMVVLALALT